MQERESQLDLNMWTTAHIHVYALRSNVTRQPIVNMTLYIPGYPLVSVGISFTEWQFRRRQWGKLINHKKATAHSSEFFYHINKAS